MLLNLSIFQIGSFNHGLVSQPNYQDSSFLLANSIALGPNVRRTLQLHPNSTGVEISTNRIGAVVAQKSGAGHAHHGSGYLFEGNPGNPGGVKLVSPSQGVTNLIEKNGSRIFVSKDAIDSSYLDLLFSNLHDAILSLENERSRRGSLGSIECGDLTIYPTMHGSHLSGYVIQTIREPKIITRISIGTIDTGTGRRSTAA